MNCIKCGREIPDGELFCVACSLAPEKREISATRQQHRTAAPRPVSGKKRLPAPQPKSAPKPKKLKKHVSGPAIAIVLLSVFLAAALGFIGLSYGYLTQERARMRTREADLLVRENEAAGLEREKESLTQQLAAAQENVKRLETEVDRLERQLNDSEGSVSQAEYDMSSQQQELERLTSENQDLLDAADELDRQVKNLTREVTALEERVETLTASNALFKERSDFMDNYVVFVNNDGSKLYHSYSCRYFSRQNFWAYSRKLAESNGFSPCKECQKSEG